MNCPFCKSKDTKVLDSRLIKNGSSTRRRRSCVSCKRRFTTYETIELTMPKIYKKDGRREDFSREKLYGGLEKACQKLPVSSKQIENIIDRIEKSLIELNKDEIRSRIIGNHIMKHLRDLHPVAYIRFASVYKNYDDIEQFFNYLKEDTDNLFFEGPTQ